MRFHEATERFNSYLRGNSHSPLTAHAYKSILQKFPRQNIPIENVTPQHLQDFLHKFSHLSPSSRNLKKSAVRSFIKWCLEMDYLDKDISRAIKFERVNQKEAKFFDASQIQKFREAIKGITRDEVIFTLFIETGLRLSELRSLNCGMVRGKSSFLIVGKGNKSREVFLSASLQEMVTNHCGKRKDSSPFFLSSWGRRLCGGQISFLFKRYCRKASLPILSPHCLRHSFAMKLYQNSKDLLLTQNLLGHSSPSMTQRYAAHFNNDVKKQAIENLWQEVKP